MNNVINVDALDKAAFNELESSSDVVRRLADKQTSTDLLTDAFGCFYKHAPRLQEQTPTHLQLHRKVIEQMMGVEQFDHLRQYTKGDPISAMGALGSVEQVLESLPEEVKEQHQRINDAKAELEKMLEGNVDPTQVDDLNQQIEQAQQAMAASFEEAGDQIRMATRKALRQAQEEAEAQEAAAAAFGFSTEDSGAQPATATNYKERMALAAKFSNPKLQQIVNLVGRMKRSIQRKLLETVEYERMEITGVEYGNRLADVAPMEYAQLAADEPALEHDFYNRFLEGKLLQYERQGKAAKDKGPMLLAVDCSSSMAPIDLWSKALALAAASLALKDNRNVHVFLFNDRIVQSEAIKPGEANEKLLDLALAGVGGNTSYGAVINHVMELTEEVTEADVLIITDGESGVGEDLLKAYQVHKAERGYNVFSLWTETGRAHLLEQISDRVIPITQIKSGDAEDEASAIDVVVDCLSKTAEKGETK